MALAYRTVFVHFRDIAVSNLVFLVVYGLPFL